MIEALLISIKLSLFTTLTLFIISLPLAYVLAYKNFPLKFLLEFLIISPLVIPPSVLGFYIIYFLSPESVIGKALKHIFGKTLLFSFEGILLASVISSLPFGVLPLKSAFKSVKKRYIEIAYVFGYSPLETFFKVILPNAKTGIFVSLSLVFAHTMGEFGVILIVGGNIPGETQTLSIYIYDEIQALNYASAHLASFILLVSSFIGLLAIFISERKERWKVL